MTLETLAPLGEVEGVSLVSLQKGPAVAQLERWRGAPILNAEPRLESFEDTAALIANLDLVVAVDTSINHLAGAMGCPAWVLMPFAPDWRWLEGRSDTPWYPSLRIYRQSAPRSWGDVVQRVVADLRSAFG